MMKILKIVSASMALILFSFTSCNKDDNQFDSDIQEAGRKLEVFLTDSPGDFYKLDIEIIKVEAYLTTEGWITLSDQNQMLNILDLTNGIEAKIASSSLIKSGIYNQLRLTFGDQNSLVVNSDLNLNGTVTSNLFQLNWDTDKKVLIPINKEVNDFNDVSILLDFDVVKSIKENAQQYVLTPAISEIEDKYTGIQGELEDSARAAVILRNSNDTISTYTSSAGKFLIRGVQQGTYDLIILPDESELSTIQDRYEINGVIITEGSINQIGTINL